LPVEVPVGELFTLLRGAEAALADSAPHRDVAESLIVARVLRMLGYLSLEAHAPDIASTVQHSPYTREALEQAVVHQSALNTLINRALRAAEL
jgi:hypothetical protein